MFVGGAWWERKKVGKERGVEDKGASNA